MTQPNPFMHIAVTEALRGMRRNHGGPFGAVIVRANSVIARAHNEVLKTQDPTAHAEILAIRKAAKKLGRFDLSDCEIYSSCEPCPMCFAAILWAKIPRLYYGCTHADAAKIGFDDATIYQVIRGETSSTRLTSARIDEQLCRRTFEEWLLKQDRKLY
ncbi:nucleoside deaminase [candidate division KSB1 bacterium]|nr:nucleoside deaminase [candidate division KSB1 bacterium]